MTVKAPTAREVDRNIRALIGDFDNHPDAFLQIGEHERAMARGDSGLHVAQFLVFHTTFELAGNPNESLKIIQSIQDGIWNHSESASFATARVEGKGEFGVEGISTYRSDRIAAIKSAKLLLYPALEAEPLLIDKEVAQLLISPSQPIQSTRLPSRPSQPQPPNCMP